MNPPSRPKRRWWLLALILAGGLAWGGHTLSVALRGDPHADVLTAAGPSPRTVVAFGFVDVEEGISRLYFTVPGGQVSDVLVKEGECVPAGAVLARLDDTSAQKKVEEAEAGLKAARADLDRGRSLPEQHQIKLEQAQAAIEVAQAQRNAAKVGLERKEELAAINQLNPRDLSIARDELRMAEEALGIKQGDLRQLRLMDPKIEVLALEAQVARAEALLAQARAALKLYALVAPAAGTVLQLSIRVGDTVGGGPQGPEISFCPQGPRVVWAEVEQSFAALVAPGQPVSVEDDTHAAGLWTGRVKRVADWYTQQRPVLQEPNQYSDVRTMRCLIELDPNQPRLRINQRVRVTIEIPAK